MYLTFKTQKCIYLAWDPCELYYFLACHHNHWESKADRKWTQSNKKSLWSIFSQSFLKKNKKKETISGLKQKLYKMSLEHLPVPESKEVFKHTHTYTQWWAYVKDVKGTQKLNEKSPNGQRPSKLK